MTRQDQQQDTDSHTGSPRDGENGSTTINQSHIYNPEKEFTLHSTYSVRSEDVDHLSSEDSPVELVLTEGGDILPLSQSPPSTENPILLQSADNHTKQRTITHHPPTAVGHYLHGLEIFGVGEDALKQELTQMVAASEFPWNEYQSYISTLSASDRKLRLLDLLDHRVEELGDWASKPYLETARWRSTELRQSGKQFGKQLVSELNPHPRRCYRNAQQAAIKHIDNHLVSYVEGIAFPKHGGKVIRHAWIEYDGSVVEITWPWHRFDGSDAVYFGVEFDKETVEEQFESRRGGTQLAISDEQLEQLRSLRSAVDL